MLQLKWITERELINYAREPRIYTEEQIGATRQRYDEIAKQLDEIRSECDSFPPKTLTAFSISDFLAMELKPRDTILTPWLHEKSLTMVHAKREVGKTFATLSAAYTIACGGSTFAGRWNAPKPRHVLYVYVDGELPDFHSRFLHVQRNWVDGVLTTPKSGEGRRVAMSRVLTETLKAFLVERKKDTLKHGWGDVPLWVFTSEVGTRMNPDNFRKRVWPKLLAKAGLRQIRMHDLRHTFASLLIQQGESLVYVKEQMGHHSIRVTVDTYGHLVPGGNKAAVDRLDEPHPSAQTTIRNQQRAS